MVDISKDVVYWVWGGTDAHVGEGKTTSQFGGVLHKLVRCALSSFMSQCHRASYEIVDEGLSAVPRIL